MIRTPRTAARAALAAAALLLGACSGDPAPVALGVSSSTSHMNAARLAISDAAPGLGVPLDTVFIGESYSTAGPALRASQVLVSTPGMVAVMGHSNSGASLAASPVYNDAEIVQVAPTSTAPAYSMAGPYSFRLVPPDSRQGAFLAEVLAADYPPDVKVAITYVNDDYGRGLHRSFREAASAAGEGPEIVLELPHMDNLWMSRDSAAYLEDALVAADPDVVLWLSRPSSLGPLLPGLWERMGRDLEILGGDALSSAPTEPAWPDGPTAIRYAGLLDLAASPEAERWAARYRNRFGHDPTPDAALAYDATRVILAAIEAGARSGPEVRRYLRELGRDRAPYPGLSGPIAFDDHGDVQRTYHLLEVGDGGAP